MLEVDCSFCFTKKVVDSSRIQSGNFGCLYSDFLHRFLVSVIQDSFGKKVEKNTKGKLCSKFVWFSSSALETNIFRGMASIQLAGLSR